MSAVIDTGPLLVFAKLQRLHLLESLFQHILIPQQVHYEAVTIGLEQGYADAVHLQAFLANHRWPIIPAVTAAPGLTARRLGAGETQAITIAQAQSHPLLIDDSEARSVADEFGIPTLGSLGILAKALRETRVTASEFDELLTTIETRPDIWISPE